MIIPKKHKQEKKTYLEIVVESKHANTHKYNNNIQYGIFRRAFLSRKIQFGFFAKQIYAKLYRLPQTTAKKLLYEK